MFTELLALLFGQTAAESLRNSRKPHSSFLERNTDAMSGASSAVLGSFGLLLGLGAALIGLLANPGTGFAAVAIIAVIGFGCSYFGFYFGRRAPHVTQRFLGMARYAVVVSAAGVVVSVMSAVVAACRNFL